MMKIFTKVNRNGFECIGYPVVTNVKSQEFHIHVTFDYFCRIIDLHDGTTNKN